MTKRIVSGLFILTALGALGVILAGALSSGEQLIVRFLTAVIVAALGLYVISDLRLQANEDKATSHPRDLARLASAETPSNSTAAFMATVTQQGKRAKFVGGFNFNDGEDNLAMKRKQEVAETKKAPSDTLPASVKAEDARAAAPDDLGAAPSSTTEHESAVVEGAGSPPTSDRMAANGAASPESGTVDRAPQTLAFAHPPADLSAPSPVEQFAWPTPPAHPNGQHDTAQDAGDHKTSPINETGSVDQPDGYRVEVTGVDSGSAFPSEPGRREFPLDLGLDGQRSLEDPQDISDNGDNGGAEAEAEAETDHEPLGSATPVLSEATSTITIPRPGATGHVAAAADYADAPLADIIDLRGPTTIETDMESAIKAGELEVVATLIEQGVLSTSGPISDREVRTMVYVAFTSNELRKLLRSGGQVDQPNGSVDLGPVELFDPKHHRPAPARLYSGLPSEPSDAIFDATDFADSPVPQRQLG